MNQRERAGKRHSGYATVSESRRVCLPAFVSRTLEELHVGAKLTKGCPDLVIWRDVPQGIRLVEVKCPHWDKPSPEHEKFMSFAAEAGIPTKLLEWEFEQLGAVL